MRLPLIDPDGDEARDLLREELKGREYDRETWRDRVVRAISDFFDRLFGTASTSDSPWGAALLIVLVLLLLALAVWALTKIRATPRVSAPSLGELHSLESSEQLLQRARDAYDAGDFATAVIEGMRAVTKDHVERGVLPDLPGLTAHEASAALAVHLPDRADQCRRAAELFDQVRYGEVPATQEQADVVLGLMGAGVS